VPFVRVSRDKRGYQQIYLMDTPVRGRPSKPLLLYWYRTPPGLRVGRDPFDPELRRAIEARNPGVVFDWEKLSVLPAVPVETESWRERRQAERQARQVLREAGDSEVSEPADTLEVDPDRALPASPVTDQTDTQKGAHRRRSSRRHRGSSPPTPADASSNQVGETFEQKPSDTS
jgi:hypothetical protein